MCVHEQQPSVVPALVHAARIAKLRRRCAGRIYLMASTVTTDTFPRQQARTRRFTLGAPRSFQVSPDGARIVFLRSKSGSDSMTCLWVLDLDTDEQGQVVGTERLVVDPVAIGAQAQGSPQEQARRERSRERARGGVAFAADTDFTMVAFALTGTAYTA